MTRTIPRKFNKTSNTPQGENKMQPATLENVRIGFRNFSGLEGKYNRAGDRNFAIFLDEDIAQQMAKDGWNVKYLKPREEGDEPQAYLSVSVNFRGRPPRIVMVTSRNKTRLSEGEVSALDWAEIKNVDVAIRPYEWEVSGRTGVKAYLQSIYVTIAEDDLEQKYADVPDSAAAAITSRYEEEPQD